MSSPWCRAKRSCRRNTVNWHLPIRPYPLASANRCWPRNFRDAFCKPWRRRGGQRARSRQRQRLSGRMPQPARSLDAIRSISIRNSPLRRRQTCARCRVPAWNSRPAMPLPRAPLGEYDVIAVTGSLPVYDARFERSLRLGGRLFAIVGEAPVMDAILVREGRRCRMDPRKPVRDRCRTSDQRHCGAKVRILRWPRK